MSKANDADAIDTIAVSSSAISALTRSEIDQQVATAKAWPRQLIAAQEKAIALATLDEETAGECIYALKRKEREGGEKIIEGPSARFAEIMAYSFGNCRAGARIIDEGPRFVVAQGAFADLENNVAVTYETRRRITTSAGVRYGDDMVGVTANAACAIALRNAVLKGIPKGFWRPVYAAARLLAIGDQKTLGQRSRDMLLHFEKIGVATERVLTFLKVDRVEQITLDDLAAMRGIANAIKEHETTIESCFEGGKPPAAGKVGASTIGDGRKANRR